MRSICSCASSSQRSAAHALPSPLAPTHVIICGVAVGQRCCVCGRGLLCIPKDKLLVLSVVGTVLCAVAVCWDVCRPFYQQDLLVLQLPLCFCCSWYTADLLAAASCWLLACPAGFVSSHHTLRAELLRQQHCTPIKIALFCCWAFQLRAF